MITCSASSHPPPYWGLRKYAGEQELLWGPEKCPCPIPFQEAEHQWVDESVAKENFQSCAMGRGHAYTTIETSHWQHGTCRRCGAWRGAYGLEPTVEMYVAHTIEILRELRRVLRPDGVLFWNLGDSYAGGGNGGGGSFAKDGFRAAEPETNKNIAGRTGNRGVHGTLKPKDLVLMPARVALAAQADGWWIRSMIIWAKPNPMPESVTDRPTDSYEHILMLTKSARYFWDSDAVREASVEPERVRSDQIGGNKGDEVNHSPGGMYTTFGYTPKGTHSRGNGDGGPKARERAEDGVHEGWTDATREILASRNMRNVWMFATQPYAGAHFATFPEELPRRCIMAATSAKGACRFCGAPWERVVKASGGTIGKGSWMNDDFKNEGVKRMQVDLNLATKDGYERATVGWSPTCLCRGQHGRTKPCAILDPFGGSGTTGRVAIELNRRGVLLDLAYTRATAEDREKQREYDRLALTRLREVQRVLPL